MSSRRRTRPIGWRDSRRGRRDPRPPRRGDPASRESAWKRPISVAIRGGLVVTATGSRVADVRVDGERISHIGRVPPADRDVDAGGLFVLPGCVDLHTHLASTPTWSPLDDFAHGSRAAVAGGVTTVVSMVYQEDGSLRAGLERGLRDATRSIADFSFHVVVTDPSDAARDE